jgi:Cd2+/Zn2+-exporting ATPase
LEELCCANCGAKIERAVNELPSVEEATLVFPTKQLRVKATNTDGLREEIERIARGIESDITVRDRDAADSSAAANSGEHSHDGSRDHEHAHPSAHAEETQKKPSWIAEHKQLTQIICGAVLFIAGLLFEHAGGLFLPSLACYILAYLILGYKVIAEAVQHLFTGLVFDENFLMTVATLGAFAIQEFPEAVGVMLFFQIGEYFEEVAVAKSRSQIMQAVDLRPEVVTKETGDSTRVIPASNARIGDILIVRPGDRVPLDGTVLSGESYLDTSAITGEPVPVRVSVGDELTSGCVNTDGVLRMRVDRPLSESMVTRILDSVENAAASKPKIDRFITRFARVYTPCVVALAAIVAIIPSVVTGNWHHWIYTALTFLVISCPCALVLSVPLAFFAGIGTGSRKGILFKGGLSLEALSDVKAVVMDKTGTLTHGTFTVTGLEPADGVSQQELLTLTACCEQTSTHPIASSILALAKERGCVLSQPEDVHEAAGHGIAAKLGDSHLLCGNAVLMEQEHIAVPPLTPAPGATVVLVARDGQYLGRLLLSDTLKDGASQMVSTLKSRGITSAILTGDTADSAAAIAQQAGIPEVYAQLLPQDKLSRLRDLRQKYGPVLFVGDGINDAPVLAGADVGAAMGSGADAAIEAADVVFLTSELSAIAESISLARSASGIAMQNVVFALAIKLLVMILGLFGIASMWLAVFADTGVAMLCVLNSIRILYRK